MSDTNNKPLLTIPPTSTSVRITPEMIQDIMAKHPSTSNVGSGSEDMYRKTTAKHVHPPIKNNVVDYHSDGQYLVLGPTSIPIVQKDRSRFCFVGEDGMINIYYDGKSCGTSLTLNGAAGLLTGLLNLIIENLPCNYAYGGADEVNEADLRDYLHNITHGVCQFAESCTNDDTVDTSVAVEENNLYAYNITTQGNTLDSTWEPYSPTHLNKNITPEPAKTLVVNTDDIQTKLAQVNPEDLYSNSTHQLLASYFGEEYLATLTAVEYYELIDELYMSGVASINTKQQDPSDVLEEGPIEIVHDEYEDFHYGKTQVQNNLVNPYEDLGDCLWYPDCGETPDDETIVGIYNSETDTVKPCYSDAYGYPVEPKGLNRSDMYPTAFMDITVDAITFTRSLLAEIPEILIRAGLMVEIGPTIKSITSASLYAVLSTDPNINQYGTTAGMFKRIAFGTHTTYVQFRYLVGNILAQLMGVNIQLKNENTIVSAEIIDILDEIYSGVDNAIYTAYIDFRRNFIQRFPSQLLT